MVGEFAEDEVYGFHCFLYLCGFVVLSLPMASRTILVASGGPMWCLW